MIRSVGETHADIHHGKAERSGLKSFHDAVFHRGYVLLRHHAAGNRIGELDAFTARQGRDLQNHIAELAMSAGLFLVPATNLCARPDRFLIGHMGHGRIDAEPVFSGKPFLGHPEVHLTLTAKHGFAARLALMQAKGRILLDQFSKSRGQTHLVLTFGCGQGNRQHRLRKTERGRTGSVARVMR